MKKIFVTLMMVVTVLSLTACGQQTNDESNTQIVQEDTVKQVSTGTSSNNVFVYVDPETGVNYLIYHGYRCGGITPRYDSEGNIMITNE